MKLCVVGGGWAGIAAAVAAARRGHDVTLLEMAAQLGGRARRVDVDGVTLDNGQHILIGAYRRTLGLMATVGARVDDVLARRPLELLYPDGTGLRLRPGSPVTAFVRGVAGAPGWSWHERLQVLRAAATWAATRFRCAPAATVAELTAGLPARVRAELIDPLCVAALNTPASQASAEVFLRVLRDALFAGRGSADLLLPRRSLSDLLPEPAGAWMRQAGVRLRLGTRVLGIDPGGAGGWRVRPAGSADGDRFDGVVLACSAPEAARLAGRAAPEWAARAAAFDYEPIATVYLRCRGARLPGPMVALRAGPDAPAQFVFDHGALSGTEGVFAAVVSGARMWVERGADETSAAVVRQLTLAFPAGTWPQAPVVMRALVEKRATFLCTPGLQRPSPTIAPGLAAAGDYVDGPYPATLEGAVMSGEAAAAALSRQ